MRTAHEFVQAYASLKLPEWDVPVGVFRVAVVNHPEGGSVMSRNNSAGSLR
jgi:hypothetical protein